jgi:hypothetical protein
MVGTPPIFAARLSSRMKEYSSHPRQAFDFLPGPFLCRSRFSSALVTQLAEQKAEYLTQPQETGCWDGGKTKLGLHISMGG